MNIGDRVQRKDQDHCGIVQAIDHSAYLVKVHWGTRTNTEGKPGVEITEWIPEAQLEPWPHTVVSADEIAARTMRQREREIHDPG